MGKRLKSVEDTVQKSAVEGMRAVCFWLDFTKNPPTFRSAPCQLDPYHHLLLTTVHDDDHANDRGAYDELTDYRADRQHDKWHYQRQLVILMKHSTTLLCVLLGALSASATFAA